MKTEDITPQVIKDLCQEHGVSYKAIYAQFGWSKSWWMKMMNGEIPHPSPKRMSLAYGYIHAFVKMRRELEKHAGEL